MNPPPTPSATNSLIPVDEVAAVNALRAPDPMLEELNVVRIEGRYFCFDWKEAARRSGVFKYRDGNRGLIIEVSPRYGHPSLLAYKVLQSIFRKITQEGKPYPDTVSFSYRELASMAGRETFGGNDAKQLYHAIRQLEDTKVELFLYDDTGKSFRSFRFNLIVASGFIGSGEITAPTHLKAAALTLNPVIVDNMRNGHFAIFNWARFEKMEPLSAALYKRLYLHFSNLFEQQYDKAHLKFEKDYEAICAEWLGGLKPERYKSRILQQLGNHFGFLRASGLIRLASIEEKSSGEGFKLVFRPGAGFFEDYEGFYKGGKARTLQFQHASDHAEIKGPIESVAYFYKKLNKVESLDGQIFTEKDTSFAKSLIERIGEQDFIDLVDYTLTEAPKTNFNIKNIRAIEIYLPAWQIAKEERRVAQEQRKKVAQEQQAERLKSEYEKYCHSQQLAYVSQLTEDERESLQVAATEQASLTTDPKVRGFKLMVRVAELKIVSEIAKIPSFEQWLKARH
jgi:hypothetical protein